MGDSEHADAVYHSAPAFLSAGPGLAAVGLRTGHHVLRSRARQANRAANWRNQFNDVSNFILT